MDINRFYSDENEKPLDRLVSDGGFTAIFRTIGIIGDSLASGELESYTKEGFRGYHDFYEYSWGQFMARTLGSTVYNFSRGGMTAKEFFESWGEEHGVFGTDKLCQAYIIALGVNDSCRFDELGDVDTAIKENPSAEKNNGFLNYYAGIVKRIKVKQPKAKFFFVTIPSTTYRPPELRDKQSVWCEGLRALAERLDNTYVIDLRKYAPLYDEKMVATFFMGHMRPTGYLLTAKMMMSYIDYIIRNNPDDFAEVGFIGTPYSYYENKKD